MVLLYQDSVLKPWFKIFSTVYAVRLYASGTKYKVVSDYMGELFTQPANMQGFCIGYLPREPESRTVPLFRIGTDRYSDRPAKGATLLGHLETEPQPAMGMIDFGIPPNSDRGGQVGPPPPVPGYAYVFPPRIGDLVYQGQEVEVTIGERTDRVFIARVCGAYVCKWAVTIPSAGIADEDFLRRYDFGEGISSGDFYKEGAATPGDFLIHNPTEFGTVMKNLLKSGSPDDDFHIAQVSPVVASEVKVTGSQIYVASETVPVEFAKDTVYVGSDHGADTLSICVYPKFRNRSRQWINWRNRAGVMFVRSASYAPVEMSTADFFSCTQGRPHFCCDKFDEAYVLDVATDTLTSVGWTPADGYTLYSIRHNDTFKRPFTSSIGVHSASLCPSGYCGAVINSTTTGLAVGLYCRMTRSIHPILPDYISDGVDSLNIEMGHIRPPLDPNELVDDVVGQGIAPFTEARGRHAGWHGFQYWQVTGTLAYVRAQMRQLYLDGYGQSEWNGVDTPDP